MSRKTTSFGQLAKYMDDGVSDKSKYNIFSKNLYSRDRSKLIKEFLENSALLRKRKNGNYLYHEVISITRSHEISENKQKEILFKLISDYVELRAKNNLVYGRLHSEKEDNLHFHLMISSNELSSEKRHRLDKRTYSKIQKDIEKYILNNYPKLEQQILYNQNKQGKVSNKEYELKKRTGKKSVRDIIKDDLTTIFSSSKNKQDLFSKLSENGFDLYVRGKTVGVKKTETGKNYRLNTLGLLDGFNQLSDIIETDIKNESKKDEQVKQDKKEQIVQDETIKTTNNKIYTEKQNTAKKEEKQHNEPNKQKSKKEFLKNLKAKLKQNRSNSKQNDRDRTK